MKKTILMALGIVLIVNTSFAQDYVIEKVNAREVKIRYIKTIKNIDDQDIQVYDNEEQVGYGNVTQRIFNLEKQLADWNNQAWIDAKKAEIQEKIDVLTAAKAELEKE